MVPSWTVVIPSRDRPASLARLLDALTVQAGIAEAEIVVVDDGSAPPAVVAAPNAVLVRVDRSIGPGPARNRGWRAGSAPRVAFVDDDCVPAPGWLAALEDGLDIADVAVGRTVPDPGQRDEMGPFSHFMAHDGVAGYPTCNIAYRRHVLETVDGFDETAFAVVGPSSVRCMVGEDTDLGLRAEAAGFRAVAAPAAVVRHDVVADGAFGQLRNAWRLQGFVRLVARHPSLRAGMRRRLFYIDIHEHVALLVATGGALALRPGSRARQAAAFGAAALYTRGVARARPRPRRWWHWPAVVPAAFAVDVSQLAVMVVASVRHRVLVL